MKGLFEGFPEKLPSPEAYHELPPFSVRFSDLDWYHHVNNMKYLEWILDSYPWEHHQRLQIASFEINFLSETHYGDEVSLRTQRLEGRTPCFLHSLYRKKDGQEVCIACIAWQDRPEIDRREP